MINTRSRSHAHSKIRRRGRLCLSSNGSHRSRTIHSRLIVGVIFYVRISAPWACGSSSVRWVTFSFATASAEMLCTLVARRIDKTGHGDRTYDCGVFNFITQIPTSLSLAQVVCPSLQLSELILILTGRVSLGCTVSPKVRSCLQNNDRLSGCTAQMLQEFGSSQKCGNDFEDNWMH